MGIFIDVAISKSITRSEWKSVYDETLLLIREFPLAEVRSIPIGGVDTLCHVRTKERVIFDDWPYQAGRLGWRATGDYTEMKNAEEFCLFRDQVADSRTDSAAGDAILYVFPHYPSDCQDIDNPLYENGFVIWGNKTQGEPYHMHLLAVACLIESRLGRKAFIFGDITSGQCRKAVEMANQILQTPITMPDRCDMQRFFDRVSALPIPETEMPTVFETFYLGTRDASFGDFFRSHFSEDACAQYWKRSFQDCKFDTIGFSTVMKQYLLFGFDLRTLCDIVVRIFGNELSFYEKFIREVMDAKLHIKDKDCVDMLDINQEDPSLYSADSMIMRSCYIVFRNKKVDRYIPLQEIRDVLTERFDGVCDVNRYINAYIEDEVLLSKKDIADFMPTGDSRIDKLGEDRMQNLSGIFSRVMELRAESIQKRRDAYDISECEDLFFYKRGDRVYPDMEECLKREYAFYRTITEEEAYHRLLREAPIKRYEFLIENNTNILLRDEDWKRIYDRIAEKKDAFARYYPMVRIDIQHRIQRCILQAIASNDELYEYCTQISA